MSDQLKETDLLPGDVQYDEVEGDEGTLQRASLCFSHLPGMVQHPPKCYIAHGKTKDEARAVLVLVMCSALEKLL
jgi:hypothetical protein